MKKTFIIIASLLFSVVLVKAQPTRSVNLELFGACGGIGVSFDSRLKINPNFGYKVGLGYGFEYHNNNSHRIFGNTISLPVNAYYLFGKKNHYLELGAGVSTVYSNYNYSYLEDRVTDFSYFCFAQVAYRYESTKSPFVLSVGVDLPIKTPGSYFVEAIDFLPKVSLGYRF